MENLWFPIAGAVLKRHHPEVHEQVFHNLTQTYGNQVLISVSTFIRRIDEVGAAGRSDVLATLSRHGLNEAALDTARALLARVMRSEPGDDTGAPGDGPAGTDDAEALGPDQAEEAMWAYYLQWSAIARNVIADRRLLRQLGFLRTRRGGAQVDDGSVIDDGLDDGLDDGGDGLGAEPDDGFGDGGGIGADPDPDPGPDQPGESPTTGGVIDPAA